MKHLSSRAAMSLVLAVAAVTVACDKVKPPQPELQPPSSPSQTPPTSQTAPAPQDGERMAFTETAQKELDKLREDIAEIKAKAEAASAQTRTRLLEEVQKLEAALGETQQNLGRLKEATVESWNQMRDSFSGALEKLKGAVKDTGGQPT